MFYIGRVHSGRVCSSRARAMLLPHFSFSGFEPLFAASKRRECYCRTKMIFNVDLRIGYSGSLIDRS